MKNWINKIGLLFVCSLALWSCEKDEDRAILRVGSAPALTASSTALVLEEESAAEEVVSFTWTPSDFGYNAAVSYVLQVDLAGNNFAAPAEEELGTDLQRAFTVGEFNSIVNRLEITGFEENELEVRVRAEVSDLVEPVYSNAVPVTVTPYLSGPPYPTLYLVGDATENDWDNTRATPMFRSGDDLFLYTYTGRLEAGNVKFLGELGAWAPQWGTNDSGELVFRETEADADPGSIVVPATGFYTLQLDSRNSTYSLEPYDAAGAETFPSIGIIGGFNGWADIEPMTNSALNPHIWSIDYTFAEDTELKFRHAPNWDRNWGAPAGSEAALYNVAVQGGPNIQVAAGTYMILFNDLTGEYTFLLQ
jgi:hypothetical protein